jgi:hypothetical protein
MNDMSAVITPKSDQLNSDDLIAGPRTITIREVAIRGGQEQPVSIYFEGDNGKPWKPCKSMSRVLVAAWGPDASQYVGRGLTLYRDPKVKWAGMEVGGIRISHMSHIDGDKTLALTVTKGKREMTVVKPLASTQPKPDGRLKAEEWAEGHIKTLGNATTLEAVETIMAGAEKPLGKMKTSHPDLWAKIDDAYRLAKVDLEPNVAAIPTDGAPADEPPADF